MPSLFRICRSACGRGVLLGVREAVAVSAGTVGCNVPVAVELEVCIAVDVIPGRDVGGAVK